MIGDTSMDAMAAKGANIISIRLAADTRRSIIYLKFVIG